MHESVTSDPDALLMLEARHGSVAAFEQLMKRYEQRVARLLRLRMGSSAHVEDLSQEVFLRVFRSRGSYVPRAKFSTWLFRIASNVAANARRYQRSRRREVLLDGYTIEHLSETEDSREPDARLAAADAYSVLLHAIEQLNERERQALMLQQFEGMSHAQIAVKMSATPDAVKSLLFRAREKLRRWLQPASDVG